jgi:putative cell wall-binding protein
MMRDAYVSELANGRTSLEMEGNTSSQGGMRPLDARHPDQKGVVMRSSACSRTARGVTGPLIALFAALAMLAGIVPAPVLAAPLPYGSALLPAGTRITGSLEEYGHSTDLWAFPVYPGQSVDMTFTSGGRGLYGLVEVADGNGSMIWDWLAHGTVPNGPGPWPRWYTARVSVSHSGGNDLHLDYLGEYALGDPTVNKPITRVAGSDRYQTAIKISRQGWTSSGNVIVCTGENFPDALAASGLAGALDCPILLVRHDAIPAGLVAELNRLGVSKVHLIGGTAAVGDSVKGGLASATRTVKRIGGANRWATAALILDAVTALGGVQSDNVFVVNGYSYADALSVSAFAAQTHSPILLVGKDSVPASTTAALSRFPHAKTHVIGGTSVISGAVFSNAALSAAHRHRVSGATRYDTCLAIVSHAYAESWFANAGSTGLGVATGENYPDALGGGAYMGHTGGMLMISPHAALTDGQIALLKAHKTTIGTSRLFGARGVLFGSVMGDVNAALQ